MKIVERFFERFRGLHRAYGTYSLKPPDPDKPIDPKKPKIKGKALTVAKDVTLQIWEKHLFGEQGIGLVPIRDDATCVWGALDIDIYNLDLLGLEERIRELGLPLILCRTKSGGAHLYLFTSEPIPAKLMRDKLDLFGRSLGYYDIEIFPKQVDLVGLDIGNWINMPYYDGDKTVRYAIHQGNPLSPLQFLDLADATAVTEAELLKIVPPLPDGDFSDGPPCLEHLAKVGFPKGSMNHALFDVGVYYRNKHEVGWEEHVSAANQRWMGPGTFQEVMGIIKSLNKSGYKYKCSDLPLVTHCNRAECIKRPFGLQDHGRAKKDRKDKRGCILDLVDKPVKCYEPPPGSGDEPHWVFKMNGREIDLTMDIVFNQRKFLYEYLRHFYQIVLMIDEERWANEMNKLLADAEKVELPREAGPEGELWSLVEAFCTGKTQANAKEELLNNRPWTSEGRTYFRKGDLIKFLDQQRFRSLNTSQIWAVFRKNDLSHIAFNIKGKCVQCWSIPAFTKQVEAFDATPIPKDGDF